MIVSLFFSRYVSTSIELGAKSKGKVWISHFYWFSLPILLDIARTTRQLWSILMGCASQTMLRLLLTSNCASFENFIAQNVCIELWSNIFISRELVCLFLVAFFRFGRLFISSFHNMPMLLLAPSIFTHLCICQNCCYCKSFVVDHLFWSIQWKLSRERKRQDNSMRERASVTVAGCKDMKEYDA